jgi:hypothetical protein
MLLVIHDVQTSDVIAKNIHELIETEGCINACGVERMTVGISTDTLAERGFTNKLCAQRCYNKCPNIIDLYFNLAAGEGTVPPLHHHYFIFIPSYTAAADVISIFSGYTA